ncbi:hypothetical protein AHAS_Ahas14G0133300 [Arachis hypogaea]
MREGTDGGGVCTVHPRRPRCRRGSIAVELEGERRMTLGLRKAEVVWRKEGGELFALPFAPPWLSHSTAPLGLSLLCVVVQGRRRRPTTQGCTEEGKRCCQPLPLLEVALLCLGLPKNGVVAAGGRRRSCCSILSSFFITVSLMHYELIP